MDLAADQHPKVILIADDEVLIRNLLRDTLRKHYEVLIAANGGEAVQLSRNTEGVIHILLCERQMLGMNGLSLCRQIRTERPQIKTLLISSSISAPPEKADESIPLLQKPFDIVELRRKLVQLLAEPIVTSENPEGDSGNGRQYKAAQSYPARSDR